MVYSQNDFTNLIVLVYFYPVKCKYWPEYIFKPHYINVLNHLNLTIYPLLEKNIIDISIT